MIQVAIVAQGFALRAGLRALLAAEPGIAVSVEATSLEELDPLPEGVTVVVAAGEGHLAQAARQPGGLKETGVLFLIPSADALVLDPFESLELTWGLLAEDCTPEELITAVLALHEGLIVANPILLNSRRVRRAAAGEPDQPGRMITDAPLTPRERDVLQQLALGLTNKQIAVSLKISEHTVKFHISSIYTKLDVLNRADAVRAGIASGLITI